MAEESRAHYAALAPCYDTLPQNRAAPVEALADEILRALRLEEADLVADLCCGTGLFAREIVRSVPLQHQVIAADASEAMLGQLDPDPRIRPLVMEAAEFARFPVSYDKILLKDALAHLPGVAALFRGLHERLRPEGRLLVVELSPESDTALFKEARRRWETRHLPGDQIAAALEEAGFRTAVRSVHIRQRLPKADLLEALSMRYVPALASFDDAALRAGIEEIRQRHADDDVVELVHQFDLVTGHKLGPS